MNKQSFHFSLNKMLLFSYISLLAFILIIGVVLYNITYKHVRNGINDQNRLTLHTASVEIDTNIDVINAIARQVSTTAHFSTLSNLQTSGEPNFYYMGYQTQQLLKSIIPVERLLPLKNSFIYMENSNYVLSPTLFSDYNFYMYHNNRHFLSSEHLTEYLMDSAYWNRFIPFRDLQIPSDNYIYICPLTVSIPLETVTNAVLCYEFDYDLVREMFSDINLYGDGYLAAYDKNERQMFLLSQNDTTIYDYNFIKSLNFENQISQFTPDTVSNTMLVTTVVSEYNNWTYYLVQPQDDAYYSIISYRRFFIAITIAAFALGGILVFVFSSFGKKSLNHLSNELSMKESLATSLHLLVERQKPVVMDSYLRRIMEGSITTNEEMQYIIKLLSLDRPDVKFHVLYTEVTPSDDTYIQTKDMALCIQNYNMLVREALCRYFPDTGYIYKPSDRAFAILIASEKYMSFEQLVDENKASFTALHNELLSKYGIWIRGGIGDRNGLIPYTWKSYQQAKEAKTITTTENYIISCSDFANSSDVYYYSESLSVQLSGFISTGNKEQVQELFKLIHTENTLKRHLSYSQQHWLISDIRGTLIKKRHNIVNEGLDSERIKILDLIDKQFEGEMSLTALKTIALELCDVCGTDTDSNDIISKIQEYITANYHDPELGLTKISDTFGISENYFSYLFKKEVSENFSNYLENLRMAKAKEMVLESDTSLSALYQYLGYNNAASFRRVFKKNFGVSPKEMREKINAK